MINETEMAPNARGHKIFRQWWIPEEQPRAVVMVIHGLNEHSGRYEYFINKLLEQKFAVYTMDHEGMGKSEGKRMWIDDWTNWVDDLQEYSKAVSSKHPAVPLIMFGHSLGGAIAAEAVAREPEKYAAFLASGPNVGPVGATKVQFAAIAVFSRLIPGLPVAPIKPEDICSKQDVVDSYINDTLCLKGKMPARYCRELLEMNKHAATAELAGKITCPVMIQHGEVDKILLVEGSRGWIKLIPHENKKLVTWPGLYHEILNEDKKDEVISQYVDWVNTEILKS